MWKDSLSVNTAVVPCGALSSVPPIESAACTVIVFPAIEIVSISGITTIEG